MGSAFAIFFSAILFAFGLTWGQVWCIPMFLVGGYMLCRLLLKGEHLKSKASEEK